MQVSTKRHIILENKQIIENIEISDNLGKMNWYEAKEACINLGKGWRLPTKDELNMLYVKRYVVGGFANVNYWSSTENDSSNAWRQNFNFGYQVNDEKNDSNYVRAVRAS